MKMAKQKRPSEQRFCITFKQIPARVWETAEQIRNIAGAPHSQPMRNPAAAHGFGGATAERSLLSSGAPSAALPGQSRPSAPLPEPHAPRAPPKTRRFPVVRWLPPLAVGGVPAGTPHMTVRFLSFDLAVLAAKVRDTGYRQVCYRRNCF